MAFSIWVATNIAVRCTWVWIFNLDFYKYYGTLHLGSDMKYWFLQILRCAAPGFGFSILISTNITVRCTWGGEVGAEHP